MLILVRVHHQHQSATKFHCVLEYGLPALLRLRIRRSFFALLDVITRFDPAAIILIARSDFAIGLLLIFMTASANALSITTILHRIR